jgi:EAL domain-containing protein (putative c-di-GMP-specific phosphodiesterase class I)/PAS domain-containing protein
VSGTGKAPQTLSDAPLDGHQLLDSLADAAWLVDVASLRVIAANAAAAQCLGLDRAALLGADATSLLPTLEDATFWLDVRAGLHGPLESDTTWNARDGATEEAPRQVRRRIVPIMPGADAATAAPAAADAGRTDSAHLAVVAAPATAPTPPLHYLVLLQDRTRERRAEHERETALAELRATLEATADAILVTDIRGRIQAFNRRFAALWKLPAAALASRDDDAIQAWLKLNVLQPQAYQRRLDEIGGQITLTACDTLTLLDGALIERQTQPQWSQGRPIGRVFSFRELNPRRLCAPRDPGALGQDEVTALPNRTGFVQLIQDAVRTARREGSSLAVLCIELDRNLLFGAGQAPGPHRSPDHLNRHLTDLAVALRASLRQPSALARTGAARFGLVVPYANETGAIAVAQRLLQTQSPLPGRLSDAPGPAAGAEGGAGAGGDRLPLAVGIAVYPDAGLGADELLGGAEAALDQARLGAHPAWRVYTPPALFDAGRMQRLESAIRVGPSEDQFRVQYQPRLDPRTGRVVAAEALLRWIDHDRGMLQPGQFLPLAERAGLVGALDDWVLARALHQAVAWRRAGVHLILAVNISGGQLVQPGYAQRVSAVLEAAGWPAQALELDITEAALLVDSEAALASVQALAGLGVRVVLDRFGAGPTELGLLRRFPFAAVKMDRSLLRSVPRHAGDTGVASALVALAHALGLDVFAGGVENEAQRDFLDRAGCDGWQGFLLAPALDAQALARLSSAATALPTPPADDAESRAAMTAALPSPALGAASTPATGAGPRLRQA